MEVNSLSLFSVHAGARQSVSALEWVNRTCPFVLELRGERRNDKLGEGSSGC